MGIVQVPYPTVTVKYFRALIVMAYRDMSCIAMAYIVMAYIAMAYEVMVYVVMAYIAMAYIAMAMMEMKMLRSTNPINNDNMAVCSIIVYCPGLPK